MSFWNKWWPRSRQPRSTGSVSSLLNTPQTEILALQQQLFLTQQQIRLITMDQHSADLPQIIARLQQSWADMPQDVQLCLVYCLPFSHECFLYHAAQQQLGKSELKFLHQVLLTKSIQADEAALQQQPMPYSERVFDAKLLTQNHDRRIWCVYLHPPSVQLGTEQYQAYEQMLATGLAQWLNIQDSQQQIIENHRRELSAELHDSIAQILGFLRLKSVQLHQRCKANPQYGDLRESAHELANYTHYAYQQTRDLITASRLIHQELDFSIALKKIIDEFSTQSAIYFELDNRIAQLNISAQQSMQLVYIIRESLSNIVRHSQATKARIYLDKQQQQLNIAISDNGIGIEPKNRRLDSFGLDIMQERAERIGADLHISANQPQGTVVKIQLDCPSPKETQHAI